MNYSLRQIQHAIEALPIQGGDKDAVMEQLSCAIDAAEDALKSMDTLQVVTRGCVDTLLGCMMAAEAIAGKDNNNG